MAPVTSRGVVLRTYTIGETSKVVVCYTRDYGKVRLVAKGARKGGSRFGAALEPMMVSGVVFYLKEGRDLHLLSSADIEHEEAPLRRDAVRMAYGSVLVELVDRLVPELEPVPGLEGALEAGLSAAASAPEGDLDALIWRFTMALARRLGYEPQTGRCVVCGREPGDAPGFSPLLGGAVCGTCLGGRRAEGAARGNVAEIMLRLSRGEPVRSEGLAAPLRDEVTEVLLSFLESHTDRRLKLRSLGFLAQLRRMDHKSKGTKGQP
ncbi:MAG: DNA repair protein RecO [Candidatus Eisenbacteria bacterium]|nr:DNA repair protein RecO [Candidatus Eisenbacteria bacterium]